MLITQIFPQVGFQVVVVMKDGGLINQRFGRVYKFLIDETNRTSLFSLKTRRVPPDCKGGFS